MNIRVIGSFLVTMTVLVFAIVPASGDDDHSRKRSFRASLSSFQEVPSVSTDGHGSFRAIVNGPEDAISYRLRYADLEGDVLQSHIHFGQEGVNGGIMVFLCTNLGNGPAGTQPCPPPPATIEGVLTMDSVLGPGGQGISAGEFGELLGAIRAGSAYVNVHTNLFPGGEIRGQLH